MKFNRKLQNLWEMARLPKFATPQNYSLYFNCNQNCMNNSCITFILKFATIKINALELLLFSSRLCPDLFFFQKATEFPCKEIIHADSRVETLRKRVEHCVLHSETLQVDRFGKSNVRYHSVCRLSHVQWNLALHSETCLSRHLCIPMLFVL